MAEVLVSSLSNADIFLAACAEADLKPTFLCMQAAAEIKAQAVFVKNLNEYNEELRKLLSSGRFKLFISTAASDLIAIRDADLSSVIEKYQVQYIGQSVNATQLSANKRLSRKISSECNISLAREINDLSLEHRDLLVVVKKVFGDSGTGQLIDTTEALLNSNKIFDASWLVEEFVPGLELSANVFYRHGFLWLDSVLIKGRTSPSNIHPVAKPRQTIQLDNRKFSDFLRSRVERLCKKFEANGWVDFEFIITNDDLIFIEANARYSGVTRSTYHSSGVNPYCVSLDPSALSRANKNVVLEIPLSQEIAGWPRGFDFEYIRYPSQNHVCGKLVVWASDFNGAINRCISLDPPCLNWNDTIIKDRQFYLERTNDPFRSK